MKSKSQFKNLTVEQLLNKYEFTDNFYRTFAIYCAKEAMKLVDKPDPRSIRAIEVAELFVKGLASKEELVAAHSSASSASSAALNAAYYADKKCKQAQKDKLVEMINQLSTFEKLMMGIE